MATNFDLNNPLTAQIVSQGKALGYAPIQIAAIASRPYDENGGQTSGAPGDNGISFGGMQWNHDRFQNLQNFAQNMGTTWEDPKAQAGFIYHELNGPESKAGDALRNAQTPEDATQAIMSYVRPKNWNVGYDDINHGQNTLDRTSQIASVLTNGDTSGLQEGRSAAVSPQPSAAPPATAGGGYVPQVSFGSQLQNLASALMARDNPQGAAAMRDLAQNQQQQDMLANGVGQWEDRGASPNGNARVQVNKYTGAVRTLPLPESATGANAQKMEPMQKDYENFANASQQMGTNQLVIDRANDVKKAILDGTLTVGGIQQLKNTLDNYMGDSTPASVAYKEMQAVLNQQAGNILNSEKGAASNKRLVQAGSQFAPAGATFDPVTTLDTLQRVMDMGRNIYEAKMTEANAYAKNKPKLINGIMDDNGNQVSPQQFIDKNYSNLDRWDDSKDDTQQSLEDFKAAHFAKSAGTKNGMSPFMQFATRPQ